MRASVTTCWRFRRTVASAVFHALPGSRRKSFSRKTASRRVTVNVFVWRNAVSRFFAKKKPNSIGKRWCRFGRQGETDTFSVRGRRGRRRPLSIPVRSYRVVLDKHRWTAGCVNIDENDVSRTGGKPANSPTVRQCRPVKILLNLQNASIRPTCVAGQSCEQWFYVISVGISERQRSLDSGRRNRSCTVWRPRNDVPKTQCSDIMRATVWRTTSSVERYPDKLSR